MQNYLHKIALGTVQFGLDYGISNIAGKTPSAEVQKILNKAKHHNVLMLDTAFGYGDSEKVLGEINDSKFEIVSKYSGSLPLKEEFEQSLIRLSREKIYGYLFHSFDTYLKNTAAFDAMIELKRAGKVKKIGFSLYKEEELQTIFDKELEVDLIQIPMNVFNQDFSKMLSEAKYRGIEIHVRSVFSQGLFFFNKETIPDFFDPIKEKIIAFGEKAEELKCSKVQLATYFLLTNKNIDKLVIGVNNEAQLEENINEINAISSQEMEEVDFSLFKVENKKFTNPVNWKL